MPPPTQPKDQISEGEIWAARFNVGLARSQRVVSSWLAQKPNANFTTAPEESDEEDFKNVADERAPLGAKLRDDGLPESVRRRRVGDQELLEKILGKKVANARRKEREQDGKGAAPKLPSKSVVKPEESEEEEEEGRAAAVVSKSKKQKKNKQAPVEVEVEESEKAHDAEDAEPPDLPTIKSDENDEEDDARPTKRKATSYLDEVLAKKAKKSKKKKKKAGSTST